MASAHVKRALTEYFHMTIIIAQPGPGAAYSLVADRVWNLGHATLLSTKLHRFGEGVVGFSGRGPSLPMERATTLSELHHALLGQNDVMALVATLDGGLFCGDRHGLSRIATTRAWGHRHAIGSYRLEAAAHFERHTPTLEIIRKVHALWGHPGVPAEIIHACETAVENTP